MTDNRQFLDEILERYRLHANMAYSEVEDGLRAADEFKDVALPKVLDEAKQSILDWHNKLVEELLDRLESMAAYDPSGMSPVINLRELKAKQEGAREQTTIFKIKAHDKNGEPHLYEAGRGVTVETLKKMEAEL